MQQLRRNQWRACRRPKLRRRWLFLATLRCQHNALRQQGQAATMQSSTRQCCGMPRNGHGQLVPAQRAGTTSTASISLPTFACGGTAIRPWWTRQA
jgi:hypothetical protein